MAETERKQDEKLGTAPLGRLIFSLAIPAVIAQLINVVYNLVDRIYIGHIPDVGAQALTGLGLSLPVILLIQAFSALAGMGGAPQASIQLGKGDRNAAEKILGNSVTMLIVFTVILTAGLYLFKTPLLYLFGASDSTIVFAEDYLNIYLVGTVFVMAYQGLNMYISCQGFAKTAMITTMLGAVLNMALDPLFIFAMHMGVAGVALATVLSQCVSAGLVILCLTRSEGPYRLFLKELKIYGPKLRDMTKIGIPAGIQSSMFSISNVLIQSTVNSFGSVAMAGSTAAGNIEGFLFTSLDAFTQGAQSFVGQNYGAKKMERVRKTVLLCVGLVTALGLLLGVSAYLAGDALLSIYSTDPAVIAFGRQRMLINCVFYFSIGPMNIFVGGMRGMGYSMAPMLDTVFGTCVLRVLWVYTVFAMWPAWTVLFASYPVSWTLTGVLTGISYFVIKKKAEKAIL